MNQASELFVLAFAGKARVSVQDSIRLNIRNVPQPDLVLYKPRADYRSRRGQTRRTRFLVVEVSDSTLRYDTGVKVPIYAKTGVPEVWVEDLNNGVLLVYRDCSAEAYATKLTLTPDDSVSMLAFPEVSFSVRDLLLTGLPIVD